MPRDFVKLVGQGHGLCYQKLMREWWEKEFSSDVVFVFPPASGSPSSNSQTQTLRAHQSILAAASPLFAEIFDGVTLTEAEHTVVIHDYDPWIFQYALEFIYQGNLSTNLGKNDFHELVRILQDLRVDLSSKLFPKVLRSFRRQNTRTAPVVPADKSLVPQLALKVSMCPSELPGPVVTLEKRQNHTEPNSDTVDIEILIEGLASPVNSPEPSLDIDDNPMSDCLPEPSTDKDQSDETREATQRLGDAENFEGGESPFSSCSAAKSTGEKSTENKRPSDDGENDNPANQHGNLAKKGNFETVNTSANLQEPAPASSTSSGNSKEQSSTVKRKNDATRVSCEICCKNVLKHHYKEHCRRHGGEKYFDCHQCGRSFFTRGELAYHEKTQHSTGGIHQCPQCSCTFKTSFYLEKHVRSHNVTRRYACQYCPTAFHKKSVLDKHERFHTGEKPFKCGHCSKSYATEVILKRHKVIHEGFPGFQPEFIVDNKNQTGVYKCDLCLATYVAPNALIVHRTVHTGEPPKIPCKFCDQIFTTGLMARQHLETDHKEQFVPCPVCGKLSKKRTLARHIKGHETPRESKSTAGDETFPCTVCGKQFATRYSRDRHGQVHSQVKLYACAFCDESFSRKDHLERHMKKHGPKE